MSPKEADAAAIVDSELPLLSWDEIYNKAMLAPHARPSLLTYENPLAMSHIDSILSASSYPFPEHNAPTQFPPDQNSPPQLYGGLLLQNASRESSSQPIVIDRTSPAPHQPQSLQKKRKKNAKPIEPASETNPSSKKRGRPRKTLNSSTGENPEERRRMQIRLAQRAYRSRKEASITSFKSRISLLEDAVEKMSTSILSFSDELVQSGALESHPDLTGPLRDTVETCLALAKEAEEDSNRDVLGTSPHSDESGLSSSSAPGEQSNDSPPIEFQVTSAAASDDSLQWESTGPPHYLSASDLSDMEVSAFIERLQFACLYQGHRVLGDPSVPTSRLERPFRLLLTVMDRKSIKSWFDAVLYARLGQRRLEGWKEVPFFCLGGAGTHYPRPASSGSTIQPLLHPYQRWTMVQNPLELLPSTIQDELDGDWFDMADLAGFLREKGVHLRATPPINSKTPSSTQDSVNVARLIPALMNKAVCLGRTPGFRRHDVEKALLSAVWT
ncbi:Phosphoserine transaminase [Aspergillus nanangensis]|uniref:Phosphoserine transaminase n=1 Tax=Aspergillus nanangensis TaxID=2582783 RepID=A0AAD4CRZ4_ASPNN|nr:Phosphoserine transaminase [Aspergillus nanangensis]